VGEDVGVRGVPLVLRPLTMPATDLPNSSSGPKQREQQDSMTPATSTSVAAEPILAAWLKLLRDGRDWTPEQTYEYVEKTRQLQEFLDQLG
jgi:hypothetical protein